MQTNKCSTSAIQKTSQLRDKYTVSPTLTCSPTKSSAFTKGPQKIIGRLGGQLPVFKYFSETEWNMINPVLKVVF
jgi:hypothetical protein